MIVKLYCIADTKNYGDYGKKNPVVIEEYTFDSNDTDDCDSVEEYAPNGEALTSDNFELSCINFLFEDIDWAQRLIPFIILTEAQITILKLKI
jgi:hypothetical protein